MRQILSAALEYEDGIAEGEDEAPPSMGEGEVTDKPGKNNIKSMENPPSGKQNIDFRELAG